MAGAYYTNGGNLSLAVHEIPPPPNDDFDNATPIAVFPTTNTVDATLATRAPDDPNCGNFGPTVWYSLTPVEDSFVVVDAFQGGLYPPLVVFTGTPGNLQEINCISV